MSQETGGGHKGEAERMDLEHLRRNFAAFGRRDWDQAGSMLDPNIEWHDPLGMAGGGVHHGKEAVLRNWHETFEETMAEFRLEPQEMIPSGDLLFVHAVLSGRSRHEGIEVSMDLFQVGTWRNGLLIKLDSFLGKAEALEAAGLSE